MDTADGRRNNSHAVAQAAIANGFRPDIISTDLTSANVFGDMVFGLPVMMAKYLAFGLPLAEVIRAVTATPAAALGLPGKIGTLAPGAAADVAILKVKDENRTLRNGQGEADVLPKQFVPQLTILDGQVVFRQADFF
jgi:dihydroorotase